MYGNALHIRKCRAFLDTRLRGDIFFHLITRVADFNPDNYITLCIRHHGHFFCIHCIAAHLTRLGAFLHRHHASSQILSHDSAVELAEEL